MNKKESLKLNNIYIGLKEKQKYSVDIMENYTTGYKLGHLNGQIELLENILNIDIGTRTNNINS